MHQFIPLFEQSINAKRVSEDDKFYLEFDFIKITDKCLISLKVSGFIVCKYGYHFWVGMVLAIDSSNKDVQVRFMYPHYLSSSYKWPVRDYECWVNYQSLT